MNSESLPPTEPSDAAPAKRRYGLPSWLRIILAAAVALALLYTAAANLWLNVWGESTLSRRPDKLQIEYSSAWTLIPGWIHARGLRLSVQTRRNQWQLDLDRARLDIDLPALRQREFVVRSASGDGVSFYFRTRPQSEDKLLDHTDHLAPIDAFAASLAVPRPSEAAQPKRRRWRVALAEVKLDGVRELWFDEAKVVADPTQSKVQGNLDVVMRGPLQFDVPELLLDGASLSFRGMTIGNPMTLAGSASMDPTTSRKLRSPETYRGLNADLRAAARVETLDFIDALIGRQSMFSIEGSGSLDSRFVIQGGVVGDGTRMQVKTDTLQLHLGGFSATGTGTVIGEVGAAIDETDFERLAERDTAPGASLRLHVDDLAVLQDEINNQSGQSSSLNLAEAETLDILITADQPTLGEPVQNPRVLVELPVLTIPNLKRFNNLIPQGSGIEIVGGTGRVVTRLELAKETEYSQFEVEADDADLEFRGTRIHGTLIVSGSTDGNPESGKLALRNVRASFSGSTKPTDTVVPAAPVSFELKLADTFIALPKEGGFKDGIRFADDKLQIGGEISDLGWWGNPIGGLDWLRLGGTATLDATLMLSGSRQVSQLAAGSRTVLSFPQLSLGLGEWKAAAAGNLVGSIRRNQTSRGRLESVLDLELLHPTVERANQHPILLPELHLIATGPSLAKGVDISGVRVNLSIARTKIEDLTTFNDYLPQQRLIFNSGSGEIVGDLEVQRSLATGELHLQSDDANIALMGTPVAAAVDLQANLHSVNPQGGRYSLEKTSLRLTNVAFPDLEGAPDWWTIVDIEEGSTVKVGQPIEVDANVRLRLRDTTPIVALVKQTRRKIRWFSRLLEVQNVTGTARMLLDTQGLRFQNLLIEGDGLRIEGRIDLRDKTAALLLVRLHGLQAGIEVNGDWHDVNVLRPRAWFEKRTAAWNQTSRQ